MRSSARRTPSSASGDRHSPKSTSRPGTVAHQAARVALDWHTGVHVSPNLFLLERRTMSLSITCSSCGAKLRAPDNAAGRTFKCPRCGNELIVAALVDRVASQPPPPIAPIYTPSPAPDDVTEEVAKVQQTRPLQRSEKMSGLARAPAAWCSGESLRNRRRSCDETSGL
jgi:predicted RNA-binding Zn-ribbon protein involved in translation (DUF1610 family)